MFELQGFGQDRTEDSLGHALAAGRVYIMMIPHNGGLTFSIRSSPLVCLTIDSYELSGSRTLFTVLSTRFSGLQRFAKPESSTPRSKPDLDSYLQDASTVLGGPLELVSLDGKDRIPNFGEVFSVMTLFHSWRGIGVLPGVADSLGEPC